MTIQELLNSLGNINLDTVEIFVETQDCDIDSATLISVTRDNLENFDDIHWDDYELTDDLSDVTAILLY